ncbi:MAG: DinB family protein [Acidobacteriaceae bacterium]|nr:DinB family protein [Acidobacteriaceae bacterium]
MDQAIRTSLLGQYRAALAMLEQAIELCPDELWIAPEYRNRFWHVAYHAVFYTHLYIQPSEAEAHRWPKHVADSQFLGPRPWAPQEPPPANEPYSKAQVQEFLAVCRDQVEKQLPVVRLEDPSGFYWLKFNKLELQLYNLRHLEHHVGQLADRLRTAANIGLGWVGTRPA